MRRSWYLVLMVQTVVILSDEPSDYKCGHDFSRYERDIGVREQAIGKAVKSATDVLTDSGITDSFTKATESLNSFKPVKVQYLLFIQSLCIFHNVVIVSS